MPHQCKNQRAPMNEARLLQREHARTLLSILVWVSVALTVVLVCSVLLWAHYRPNRTQFTAAPTAPDATQNIPEAEDYAISISITTVLGNDEQSHGLRHITNQKDGLTAVEAIDGVPARALRLAD